MYEPDQAEAFYLAGMMLAGASKNGYIGMVAGFPFPAYYNIINGTEMGAKAVNPKATEHVIYVSSFFDPTKEASATSALISAGATAIVGSTNDPSVCETAAAAGVACMNEDLLESYGKSTYLGSTFMYTGWAIINVINAVLNHQTVTRYLYGNETVGAIGVSYGPAYKTRVSAAVQAKIQAKITAMKTGAFHDYQGPIRDNTGKLRVPAGKYLTQAQDAGQNWYVQGVSI
jgi:basic membrane lipoprotein Med (substrate-binding protein (PBP1-ABC) superfamily)